MLSSARCIVLATRSDLEGDVEIEVRVDADLADTAAGELVFEGELLTTGQGIMVGSSLTTCIPGYRSAGTRSASMPTHLSTRPG